MYNPVATYRVQLHENFTFADLEKRLSYLHKLGITTLYASPTLAATPGSTHGYDGIDPQRVNPEIGTLAQLRSISGALKAKNMGWLQDIVPNHLAYHPANPWITDVLEKGHGSRYAGYFDIPGTNELMSGTLMAPFLGKPLMAILEAGELQVAYAHQRLVLAYYDSHFPLAPHTYATVLRTNNTPAPLAQWLGQIEGLYSSKLTHSLRSFDYEKPTSAYANQPVSSEITITADPSVWWDATRLELAGLMDDNQTVRLFVEDRLAQISGSINDLHALAEAQHYRLCDGDETRHRINFRRFFTINGLICLAIERPDVFTQVHSLIQELVADGTFQGLRVDHVDGLFDPAGYLDSLRKAMGDEPYIVVEKILEPGEALPTAWPIQGTSGYDYLALVNNLLTDPQGEGLFTKFYNNLTRTDTPLHDQICSRKAYILYHDMGGELANLLKFFYQQHLVSPEELAEINPTMLLLAIGEMLVQCPVYRYYGNRFPLGNTEAASLRTVLTGVRNRAVELEKPANLLEKIWLTTPQTADGEYNACALRFYQRCMQFTGPLMAKGVEDTLLYTYFRFIGHNEVGDSPEAFGMGQAAFHAAMQDRQTHWPLAMNGTSTHDTKRGEDVRARLNVLTAMSDEWTKTAQRWLDQTAHLRSGDMPDVNDAYFILQTVVGAYPYADESIAWADEADFAKRLRDYITKALQEAKRHTNWVNPNKAYMDAAHAYIDGILDKNGPIWPEIALFLDRIAPFGIVNSLAQVLLKFTTPGVPDVYQGCELFDLSLVDPDNRRAVNYDLRDQFLTEVSSEADTQPMALWPTRTTGQIKLWLTHKLLTERRLSPDFWAIADYVPLAVSGAQAEHVLAFARQHDGVRYVTIVPLHLSRLTRENPLELDWQDTRVGLPGGGSWTDVLTGKRGSGAEMGLSVLFSGGLPMALVRVG